MFWKIVIIFMGGGIGALLRYGASLLAERCWGNGVPGTFAVNMLGCLALGALYGAMQGRFLPGLSEEGRLFFAVGLLGALTTFSTLNWEIFSLLRAERFICAVAYLLLSVAIGLLCTCAGYCLARMR